MDGVQGMIRKQLGHGASPLVQFVKYGIVGGMATGVNMAVFFLCGWLLLPCLTPDDPLVRLFGPLGLSFPAAPSESARVWNAAWCNAVGFVVSNTFCYLLNRLFVFRPGRHFWVVEFLFFFAGSAISFVIGVTLQSVMIKQFGIMTTCAFAASILLALLINYAMRKFLIFKG